PLLPGGADCRAWQRWQVETQMLLHEHAVNQRREADGLSPVSSVWFWGNGRLSDVTTPTRPLSYASAAVNQSGDLVRGFARHVGLSVDALPSGLSAILDRM